MRLDTLADGALLATVAATDQAARAATDRRARGPPPRWRWPRRSRAGASRWSPAAPATDRGIPVGPIVERAVALLAERASGVRLDADAAALIERAFQVERDAAGLRLVAEHDVPGQVRQLLGKPTPCVGRERELALLEGLYEEAVAEPSSRAVIVTGAPGVGKSRLWLELLRRLHRRDEPPAVWIARADSMSSGSPFGLLGPLVRRAASVLEGEPAEAARAKIRARVEARVDPATADRVARFLGELAGVPFPDDGCPALASARRDPRLMGDQMRNAFEDWVRAECASPLVVVLEDLHWGDLPSMSFVETLLARIHDRSLLVLGLARPAVHDVFPKLWADRGAQEVRLGPLPKRASEELARTVLEGRGAPEAIARVVELAAGNAFYLEELLRAVAEGARELPSTVLAMVEARIEGLDADARRVLRAASVFGSAAWPAAVAALLGASDSAEARAQMTELARRELLTTRRESRFAGEEEHAFRHALVRDAAYATLTDADRALGHRIAGAWLDAAGDQDSAALAEHYERGGDPVKASQHYLRAAEKAIEGSDLRASAALAERAIALGSLSGEAKGQLLSLQAEARAWLGDFDVAERAALEAMALVRPASAPWYAAAQLPGRAPRHPQRRGPAPGAPGIRRGSHARRRRGRAVREPPPHGHGPPPDDGDARRGRGDLRAARRAPRAERAPDGRGGARRGDGDARAPSGRSVHLRPRGGACGQGAPRARAAAPGDARPPPSRDLAERARRVRGGRASVPRAVGARRAHRDVRDDDDRRAQLGPELAAPRPAARGARRGAPRARAERGDAPDAHLVLSPLPRQDPPRRRRSRRGLAPRGAGDGDGDGGPAAVRQRARDARDGGARARNRDLALGCATRGQAMLEELGKIDEGESAVRLALAEALLASGREAEARAEVTRARDRLLERAAAIHDPALVRSFLGAVPENARTLELGRILVGDARPAAVGPSS